MKRFTKMLALGMAVALTFGMTVSAKWSPSTADGTLEVANEDTNKVTRWNIADEERIEVADRALDVAPGMLNGSSVCDGVKKMGVRVMEVFDLSVYQGCDVTFSAAENNTRALDWYNCSAASYGHTWGYAMIRFDREWPISGQELLKMDRTAEGKYKVHLDQRNDLERAYYVVVKWTANLATNPLHVDRDGADAYERDYNIQDDADSLSTKLNTSLADTIAQREGFKKGVAVVGGWNSLEVVKKGNLKASLPELGEGEKYIMVSCPYIYNDAVHNAGTNTHRVDLTADVPTYYVMESTGTKSGRGDGDLWYTAKNVDKGEQFLMVILVSDKADPVPPQVPQDSNQQAGGAGQTAGGAGQTTGGAVSPKTGEMLPVAVILAAVCLAGAAVCAKKARTNA